YTSGIGGCLKTRSLLAELLNKHFYPATQIEPSQIILAAGGSFALTALVEQICNPGDGILIAAPYWAGLDISISIHGHANIIPVHVLLSGFFGPESVKYYESALENVSIPIKAILVCNPHNPLGQCYPRETLQSLLDFCQRRDLHYISDEVYALSAHQPPPAGFSPFVSIKWPQQGFWMQRYSIGRTYITIQSSCSPKRGLESPQSGLVFVNGLCL
ncbi:hypothetical protein N7536_004294, partial [Penicillium majusculum]